MSDKAITAANFAALLDGMRLSKTARAALVSAHDAEVRKARDEAEARCVPDAMREAVTRAAKYGARQGYLAAVRDIADEQQKHNGDALKAAVEAMQEENRAQRSAPIGLLVDATCDSADAATSEVQSEMVPRPENAQRWGGYRPQPLAKMAERARDAEANASGITVKVPT